MEKYCRAGQATNDDKIQRMRDAGWITKAANTHLEYVIFIAFSIQQWLRERASLFRCTVRTSLVLSKFVLPCVGRNVAKDRSPVQ